MHNYTLLETKLNALLASLREDFTPAEMSEVREFIDAGEYGLALETICGIIAEEQKRVAGQHLEDAREVRDLMQFDSDICSAVIDSSRGPETGTQRGTGNGNAANGFPLRPMSSRAGTETGTQLNGIKFPQTLEEKAVTHNSETL
jgi:hypothetical protein